MPCILSFLIVLMSIIFIMLNHPISFSMIILIQTILISLMTSMIIKLSWFSYVLFLVMVGGMLVLFLYMTNVASNEKFSISNKMIMLMMAFIPMTVMMINNKQKIKMNNQMIVNYEIMINKMFNEPMNMIIIIMMIYLLITMIMTVKLTDLEKGPLRKKN